MLRRLQESIANVHENINVVQPKYIVYNHYTRTAQHRIEHTILRITTAHTARWKQEPIHENATAIVVRIVG